MNRLYYYIDDDSYSEKNLSNLVKFDIECIVEDWGCDFFMFLGTDKPNQSRTRWVPQRFSEKTYYFEHYGSYDAKCPWLLVKKNKLNEIIYKNKILAEDNTHYVTKK